MRRYLHEYRRPRDAFAGFPLLAHANARQQPQCHVPQGHHAARPTHAAGMVSDPLNLFDMAPYADGAAALLLTRSDLLPAGLARIRWCASPARAW